jgi:uncharacterized protein YwbE
VKESRKILKKSMIGIVLKNHNCTEKNVRGVVAHMQVVYSCSEKPPTAADAIANSCPQFII